MPLGSLVWQSHKETLIHTAATVNNQPQTTYVGGSLLSRKTSDEACRCRTPSQLYQSNYKTNTATVLSDEHREKSIKFRSEYACCVWQSNTIRIISE